ncbi:MAG: type II toxin-antitoxin system VapC family toxin [Deltaproteobacteria bacterium]|nr:type II toxin-antitoxin system VapC family toxin [Deltaproteobacteria bacterium]
MRQRLNETELVETLQQLELLPFRTDTTVGWEIVRRFCALSSDYEISSYDAAYLELAQRRNVGLASLDQRLNAAARAAGLRAVGSVAAK